MAAWRYSKTRLKELDSRLLHVGREMDMNLHQQRRTRSDMDAFDELGREYGRVAIERDRCGMVLWRRARRAKT